MVLLLATTIAAVVQPTPPVRAVVQEARPTILAVQPGDADAPSPFAICTEGGRNKPRSALVHGVDLQGKRLRFTVEMPQVIRFAAVSPSGEWAAVGGESDTYRLDLKTAEYSVLFADSVGQLAISPDGIHLAIAELYGEDPFGRPERACKLKVFDLETQKWIADQPTPIVQMEDICFHGDEVVGVGIGGRLYTRRRLAFLANARLNWNTDKLTFEKSAEPYAFNIDVKRRTPKEIAALREHRQPTREAMDELRPAWDAAGNSLGYTKVFGIFDRGEAVHFTYNRWAGGDNGGAWSGIQVALENTGEIEHRSMDDAMRMQPMGGDMVVLRYGEKVHPTENLLTGDSFEVPRIDYTTGTEAQVKTAAGLLVQQDDKLHFHRPGKPSLAWTVEFAEELRLTFAASSADGKFFALVPQQSKTIQIRSGETGEVIERIKRESEEPGHHLRALIFSADGKQMAVVEERFRVYRTDNWERVVDQPLQPRKYYSHLCSIGSDWLLGGAEDSIILDPMTGQKRAFEVRETFRATSFVLGETKCLLLENRYGDAFVVNFASGEVLRRWVVRDYHSSSRVVNLPPAAEVVFGGKLLIRQIGSTGRAVIARASDLQTIATVVPVPISRGQIGYIMFTPDGYWIASDDVVDAGIEKRLALFQGSNPLNADEMAKYNSAERIQAAILAAIAE